MRCCSAICFSIVFILISSESFSQNTIPEVRQKSLSRLKSGKTVRVFCDSLGAVGGKYVKMLNDTLYLGVDKRSAGTGLSQRQLLRRSVVYSMQTGEWTSIDTTTLIPQVSIREVYVRTNAAWIGALVGGVGLGGLGLIAGLGFSKLDSEGGSASSEIFQLTVLGAGTGALLGGLIGAAIPRWKNIYREPGFRRPAGSFGVYPLDRQPNGVYAYLTVAPELYHPARDVGSYRALQTVTVKVGICLSL